MPVLAVQVEIIPQLAHVLPSATPLIARLKQTSLYNYSRSYQLATYEVQYQTKLKPIMPMSLIAHRRLNKAET